MMKSHLTQGCFVVLATIGLYLFFLVGFIWPAFAFRFAGRLFDFFLYEGVRGCFRRLQGFARICEIALVVKHPQI